ncbi:hypothetical protein LPJ59_001169, partial [Coemansia sp. RSA 2399]
MPGRYASDIQGELVSVKNKRIYSSISDPSTGKDNRKEDFDTLLEQYADQPPTNATDQRHIRPSYYDNDASYTATTVVDGAARADNEQAASLNKYGSVNGSYGSAIASQMWMQTPQFQYFNQNTPMFDASTGQGLFSAPFNMYFNHTGFDQPSGYNAYRQAFHLSQNPSNSQGYGRDTSQKSAPLASKFKEASNAAGKQAAEYDSAQGLSDGELVSELDEDESMSLSEGEVYDYIEEPKPLDAAGIDMVGSTSLENSSPDVVSIVKERIDLILKNRDPKLLQNPRLRALMLLLKCIKLDDPDTIYEQVKNTSFQVVAELNSLSHEFCLGMITDACMNTLLLAQSMANTPAVAQNDPSDTDSNSADMDTSSDLELDDLPQLIDQSPEIGPMQTMPGSADILRPLSQERPPTTPMCFSRSRAPSPPSAQPKTPRTISQTSQSSNTQQFSIDGSAVKAQDAWESTVCASENGRLVVFLGSGDDSSDSDGVSDSAMDYEGDEEVGSMQQTRAKGPGDWSSAQARKREMRILNGECRRLARDEQQFISRALSFSGLNRLGANGYLSRSPGSQSTTRVAPSTPINALRTAKMNLRAHEDAIAKLKLQISRKQAAASLRKTIHLSNAQRPLESTAFAVSEPETPLAEAGGDDTVGNSYVQVVHSETKAPDTLVLPTASDLDELLEQIPAENRPSYSRGIGLILGDTIDLKRAVLKTIQCNQAGDNSGRSEAESLLSRVLPQLEGNQKALERQKVHMSRLICELQARLKLTDIQLDILDHSRTMSNELQPNPENAPLVAENKPREDALKEDIRAIQIFKDSLLPEHDLPPAAASAVDDVREHPCSDEPDSNANASPSTQDSATATPDNAHKVRHIAVLKSKLESVQAAQKGLSQNLETLAGKRGKAVETPPVAPPKGKALPSPGESMPAAKRQKTASASPPASGENSLKTEVSRLLMITNSHIKKSNDTVKQQRIHTEIDTSTLDRCILQPLIVADGIGMPALANPTPGILSRLKIDSRGHPGITTRASTPNTVVSVIAPKEATNIPASDYVPYESPFGSSDVNHNLVKTDSGTVQLGTLTTKHLLEAMRLTPVAHPASIKKFHNEVKEALYKVCKDKPPKSMIKNRVVALALLPIWKSYARTLPLEAIKELNPLYSAIGLDRLATAEFDIASHVGYHFTSMMRKNERKLMRKTLRKHAMYLPVLNRDLAFYPNSSDQPLDASNPSTAAETLATGRGARYFDAVQDAGGPDSPDADPDSGDELGEGFSDNPNVRLDMEGNIDERTFSRHLSYLWKGDKNKRSGSFGVDSYESLFAVQNKRVGKVMMSLKKALQAHPESERLWDLYLELYSRQKVADSEIVSAFSDATKFHPRSFSIWRRYIQWCSWNMRRSIESSTDSTVWHGCLSIVTSMAIKCLCAEDQSVYSETVSATIAELLVHFWDCSWATFESLTKSKAANNGAPESAALFKSRIVAHMHACLTASSTKSLCDEISDLSVSDSSTPRSKVAGNGWKSAEWVLGRVLLPHHLLFVGQVFVFCFVEAAFVPRSVLERMYASMHAGLRFQSAYYLCLDNANEKCAYMDASDDKGPQLQPYIVSVVRKLFGGIKDVLLWHSDAESNSSAQQETPLRKAIQQSCGLCSASMRATLVQLKQPPLAPSVDVRSITDCEDLLRTANKNALKAAFTPKTGLLRVVAEQSFEAPLLMTCLLCADDGEPDKLKLSSAVCALREHSVLAARSMGIDTTSFTLCTEDQISSETFSREDIYLWISGTRRLYYSMVGYTGVSQPKSERALILSCVSDGDDAVAAARSRFCMRAGTWANLAFIEVLHSVFEPGNNLASRSAVDSALVWLHHGQKQLSDDNVGGRAQLWAVIMHFSMLCKPLQQSEIVRMHNDINKAIDKRSLHITPMCHIPANFALRTVLDSVRSDDTIDAIGNYVSYLSVDNAELAIRLIMQALEGDNTSLDIGKLLLHISTRGSYSDSLLLE